jgi:hypothetical protein
MEYPGSESPGGREGRAVRPSTLRASNPKRPRRNKPQRQHRLSGPCAARRRRVAAARGDDGCRAGGVAVPAVGPSVEVQAPAAALADDRLRRAEAAGRDAEGRISRQLWLLALLPRVGGQAHATCGRRTLRASGCSSTTPAPPSTSSKLRPDRCTPTSCSSPCSARRATPVHLKQAFRVNAGCETAPLR